MNAQETFSLPNLENFHHFQCQPAIGYTRIVAALLSHGAGISLQYRLLLEDAAKARNADILHLLFEHGAKSCSELIFATLEEALVTHVDGEAWVPVFQVS